LPQNFNLSLQISKDAVNLTATVVEESGNGSLFE
jgi:hypothetical protein